MGCRRFVYVLRESAQAWSRLETHSALTLRALGRFQRTDPPRRKTENAGGVGRGARSGRSCRARPTRTETGWTLSLLTSLDESERDIGSPLGTRGSFKTIFIAGDLQ